ncbi:carbonic anhydrase [Gloeothece verrucosa]|uniref:carbonic anhydrase n=1 Tax=Gloeothece verrucosa (strain PCC 7822) TaxID=497965 RepID=E0UHC8_GLOV7|nr:carbonic anhydrase family protein [Gloeothece verrucosa]ADN16842.1 Carbonate dehydratase [Gloeothece verrucosa PCC 7822]
MNNKTYGKLQGYGILIIAVIFLSLVANLALANPKIHWGAELVPHWSYSGEENPHHWAALSPDFAICSKGQNQSPINFESGTREKSPNLVFNYQNTPLNIVNNGHTIQINYAKGSRVIIGDKDYELMQFHFHTPSEHTINKKVAKMELHLVHKNEEGEIAVIGILIQQGQEHPLIKKIWQYISPEQGEKNFANVIINAKDFIPVDQSYYNYIGSLTTPPCTEGVNWFVFKTPLKVSPQQIQQFTQIYQLNARPVQPLNQREIVIREY